MVNVIATSSMIYIIVIGLIQKKINVTYVEPCGVRTGQGRWIQHVGTGQGNYLTSHLPIAVPNKNPRNFILHSLHTQLSISTLILSNPTHFKLLHTSTCATPSITQEEGWWI